VIRTWVRNLVAVDVPALRHLVNVLVFPSKGPRPHPDECSGSDLDGDEYWVCWDSTLIPPQIVNAAPMDYSPAKATEVYGGVKVRRTGSLLIYVVQKAEAHIGDTSNARENTKSLEIILQDTMCTCSRCVFDI
jgi:RNA-dependent RNA polymerase